MTSKKNCIYIGIPLLLILLFYMVMGILTPFFDDDYLRVSLAGGFWHQHWDTHKILWYLHYNFSVQNARFGDTLSILYFLLDTQAKSYVLLLPLVQITNLFLLFMVVLGRPFSFSSKKDGQTLFFIFVCYTVLTCVPGQTLYWVTGFFNYSLQLIFTLLFLLPFRYRLSGKILYNNQKKEFNHLLILAIPAGMGFENATPILLAGLFLIVILGWKDKIRFHKQNLSNMVYGLFFYGLGLTLMIKPSLARTTSDLTTSKESIHQVLSNLISIPFGSVPAFDVILVILLVVLAFYLRFGARLGTFKLSFTPIKRLLGTLGMGLLCMLPLIAVKQTGAYRSYFIISIIFIIGIVQFYRAFALDSKGVNRFILLFGLLFCVGQIISYITPYQIHRQMVQVARNQQPFKTVQSTVTVPYYNKNDDKGIMRFFKPYGPWVAVPSCNMDWLSNFVENTFNAKRFIIRDHFTGRMTFIKHSP